MSQILPTHSTSNSSLFSCIGANVPRCNLLVTTIVIGALYGAYSLYQHLLLNSMPFDGWSDRIKWTSPPLLSKDEVSRFGEVVNQYPPEELARRCFARQKMSDDWFTKDELENVHTILPTYQENRPRTIEDENAAKIQSLVINLQPVFAFIRDVTVSWRDILQPIQTYPRFTFTILFNCLAPYVFGWLVDGLSDFIPSSFLAAGRAHRGKMALASLGMTVWLYYKMHREKGNIVNITDNFTTSEKNTRGIDLIPSYQKCLKEVLLPIIGSFDKDNPKPKSNILWYYNKSTNSTFIKEIGDILGELTATRRIYDDPKLIAKFPNLRSLQVVKLNLNSFLLVHRTADEVIRGWKQMEGQIQKQGPTLVVITGLEKTILPHLLPRKLGQPKSGDSQSILSDPSTLTVSTDKLLSKLFMESLANSSFQCLIEMNEEEKNNFENDADLIPHFTPVKSPDITIDEMEALCIRLFSDPQLSCRFKKGEIRTLFTHLRPVLDRFPHTPAKILEVLERSFGEKAQNMRFQIKDPTLSESPSKTDHLKFDKADHQLTEALQIKHSILRELWKSRDNANESERTVDLKKAVLMMHKTVVPAYMKVLKQTLRSPHTDARLVFEMQKSHKRLYGKCTEEEFIRLEQIENKLNKKFKGQSLAVKYICGKIIDRRRLPPSDGKPLVLFFAGASGCGKSDLASSLAYELDVAYGIHETSSACFESNVTRVYLNRKTQGGQDGWDMIRNDIIKKWSSEPTRTVIFEEWDKMAPSDRSSLLDLIDESELKYEEPDGTQKKVDKSCATVIFTSNLDIGEEIKEFTPKIKDGIRKCFKESMDAEAFLNRIDGVIPFVKINDQARRELISMELDRWISYGIIEIDQSARKGVEEHLLKKTEQVQNVRMLKRFVQSVLSKILHLESSGLKKPGKKLSMSASLVKLSSLELEKIATASPGPTPRVSPTIAPSPNPKGAVNKGVASVQSVDEMLAFEDNNK